MKKAKTVKEFKRSNKKLYNDLMTERAKHHTASKMIGNLRLRIKELEANCSFQAGVIAGLRRRLGELQNSTATYKQNVTEFTRNLFN